MAALVDHVRQLYQLVTLLPLSPAAVNQFADIMPRLQGLPGEPLPAWEKMRTEESEGLLPEVEGKEVTGAAACEKVAATGKKAVPGGHGKRKRSLSVDLEVTAPQQGRKLKQITIGAQVKAQAAEAECPVCHKAMTQRQVEKHLEMCLAVQASREEAQANPHEDEEVGEPQACGEADATTADPEVVVVEPLMDEKTHREAEREEAVMESVPERQPLPEGMDEVQVVEEEEVEGTVEEEDDDEDEEEFEEGLSSDEELDDMEVALRTSMERLVALRAGEWGKTAGLSPALCVDAFVDLDDDPALLRVVENNRPNPSAYVVATTQLTQTQRQQVAQAVIALGGSETRDIAEATHLVVPTDENGHARESRRMLEAVARGRWAVSLDWVLQSLAQQEWVEETPWEVTGISQLSGAILKGAQKSRQRGGQLLRDISITFHGSFGRQGVPPQKWLEDLAVAAGAHVEGLSLYGVERSQNQQRVTLCAQELGSTHHTVSGTVSVDTLVLVVLA